MPSNYFLRLIPTQRHYSQIASDILSGSIYILHTYIYIFFLTFEVTFCLAYTLTFFVAFYLASFLTYILDLSGIYSDILSGILSDLASILPFYLAFYLALCLAFCSAFSGRRGPLHQHLAIWGSGPCMAHSIRSWWYGVRVTRHSKGGEEDKRRRRRRRSSTFVEIYIETLTWQAEEIFVYMVQ